MGEVVLEVNRMKMPVGERIQVARMKKGMSQQELAEKIGVYQSEISRIENGKRRVRDAYKQTIADALDETIMNLFF